eukprot:SAG11_NODE_172_length_13574_cov_14.732690_7_plen_51_part_00
MRELRKRALAAGVSAEAVEDAQDSDDAKGELIPYILLIFRTSNPFYDQGN